MAATTFSRFSELPNELQIQIWGHAIDSVASSEKIPLFTKNPFWHFAKQVPNIPGFSDWRMVARLYRKKRKVVYLHPSWYFSGWSKLVNSCPLARLLALQWLVKEFPKDHVGRGRYILKVLAEIINDLKRRLRF